MSATDDPNDDFQEPPSIWELLNLPEPRRGDDRDAPVVDREVLLRLVRKEMPKEAVRAAFKLIYAYDSWKRAFAEIVIDEFRQNHPSGSRPDDL